MKWLVEYLSNWLNTSILPWNKAIKETTRAKKIVDLCGFFALSWFYWCKSKLLYPKKKKMWILSVCICFSWSKCTGLRRRRWIIFFFFISFSFASLFIYFESSANGKGWKYVIRLDMNAWAAMRCWAESEGNQKNLGTDIWNYYCYDCFDWNICLHQRMKNGRNKKLQFMIRMCMRFGKSLFF